LARRTRASLLESRADRENYLTIHVYKRTTSFRHTRWPKK